MMKYKLKHVRSLYVGLNLEEEVNILDIVNLYLAVSVLDINDIELMLVLIMGSLRKKLHTSVEIVS